MVKEFNINATYNGIKHMFQCKPSEFLANATKFFKLEDHAVIQLYDVNKNKTKKLINPSDLTDLMMVELVVNDEIFNGRNQRNKRSCTSTGGNQSFADRINDKLLKNNALNGSERQYLIQLNQQNQEPTPSKRKFNGSDIDNEDERPRKHGIHKKVQVNPVVKDDFTQTEPFIMHEEEVRVGKVASAERDERMKKLIANEEAVKQPNTKAEIKQYMTDTHDERRMFIKIQMPPVSLVKDKYPMLFSLEEVKNEIDRIFYVGKCEEFLMNIDKYAKVILTEIESDSDIYNQTVRHLKHAGASNEKKYIRAVGSVLGLSTLIKEETTYLKTPDTSNPDESLYETYPYISVSHNLDELFYDNVTYRVKAEKVLLCEARNFKEAILCLVGSFFIFNITYPPSCEQTMVLFEKLYLNANDTDEFEDYTGQMIKLLQMNARNIEHK